MDTNKEKADFLSKIADLENIITKQNAIISQINRIIEYVPGSFYVKDKNGVYLWHNSFASEKMRSVHLSGLIDGKTDYDLFSKEVADDFRKNDLKVMHAKQEQIIEEETTLPDETKVIQLSIKRPLFDELGEVIGIVGNTIDITDRKKAEELKIKHETAEKVIAFTKLMAGSMAHEIRTPLTTIGSRIDLLKVIFEVLEPNKEVKENFLKEYQIIKKIIKEGNHTVKDMLLKLRGFAVGKLPEVNYIKLSISKDIEQFLLNFPFEEGTRELIKFISMHDFFYLGDVVLTSHLIGNLVKNALHAIKSNCGKGDITIELKANEKFNQLIVRDTATGIPKEYLSKIFDQFETKKTTSGGTGLGLAFCKMVMESYGGSITCNSELGKHTEFVLIFPKTKCPMV